MDVVKLPRSLKGIQRVKKFNEITDTVCLPGCTAGEYLYCCLIYEDQNPFWLASKLNTDFSNISAYITGRRRTTPGIASRIAKILSSYNPLIACCLQVRSEI